MSGKTLPHLNMVVIGHVDHGKSTTTGHLLVKTGTFDQRTLDKYKKEAESMGRGTFAFAWILDKLSEERERGMTIDVAFYQFKTKKNHYTIIDAPGHRDFVKNMITGTSQADCALLVVAAAKGDFEAGISSAGQTYEHALLAFTLGVTQLCVLINKMDAVDWDEKRYTEIRDEMKRMLTTGSIQWPKIDEVSFVPCSGFLGDNLVEKSENMPWYKGLTVLESIDNFIAPKKPTGKPLRLAIQDVYTITGIGCVPVGRVEFGVMKPGDSVIAMPGGASGTVNSIEMHNETIPVAEPGDNVGFSVKGIGKNDIRKGYVIGPKDAPPTVAETFVANVIVMRHPTTISNGYTPVIHLGTSQTAVTFTHIKKAVFKGETTENPEFIKNQTQAVVELTPTKPLCVESFKEFSKLGRFAVRDMGQTVAVGVVMSVKPRTM